MIKKSNRKNKKFKVTIKGKTIHFGERGYKIKRGTKAGDDYCARSYEIKDKKGINTRDNVMSPNYWSRKMWGCIGKKSVKQKVEKK